MSDIEGFARQLIYKRVSDLGTLSTEMRKGSHSQREEDEAVRATLRSLGQVLRSDTAGDALRVLQQNARDKLRTRAQGLQIAAEAYEAQADAV